MKVWFARSVELLTFAALLYTNASAQNVGIVSYIDIEGGGLRVAECLSEEADPRVCAPNVKVMVLESFEDCEGNLSACEESVAYPVPFIAEDAGDTLEEDIDEAWDTFVDKTIDEVSRQINELPPCWLPTPCPPQINWGCVSSRVADALVAATTDFLPEYWADVYEDIALNAPLALHWQTALPEGGAVIAPLFTLTPKPDQYANLIEDVRDGAYYFQEPLFPSLPVPYSPDELSQTYGGLDTLEARKRQLEPATLPEYQQFGFVSLFEVYGDFRLELLFEVLQGPYLYTACLIPSPPFILPIPVPVPTPLYAPRAFTDLVSVPEGYGIPRVKGTPLY